MISNDEKAAQQEAGLRHQLLSVDKATKVVDCDVLIIGAGAAGLAAAAAVQNKELRVILVEKEDHVGGTTFKSGGCMWMPNNFLMREQGIEDSKGRGKQYVNAAEDDNIKTHSRDAATDSCGLRERRLDAFLTRGDEMIDYFRDQGFRWMATPSRFPDYRSDLKGAVEYGRTIDPDVFDATSLGSWQKYLPAPDGAPLIPRFEDFRALTRPPLSKSRYGRLSTFPRGIPRPVSMGRSLVAQLLKICQTHGNVEIWTSHELHSLLPLEDGEVVTGARVSYRRGKDRDVGDESATNCFVDIRASHGVVLATGGFSKNQALRDEHIGTSTLRSEAAWSLAANGDSGIALRAGQSIGASTAQLDQVWGIPTMIDPKTGNMTEAMFAMVKPFSIVVDGTGDRFLSESQPYGDTVTAMYDRARRSAETAVFWLVFDQVYIQRYPIGSLRPIHAGTAVLEGAINRGHILRSGDLAGLAEQMKVPSGALRATIDRWNEMCACGTDELFCRGDDLYQKFMGDPNVEPNPCMGAIRRSPFYAIQVFPGDAGTKGGLRTDEHARVLRSDDRVIRNLFAAGNTTAVLLRSFAAGPTITPAMTDGFIAVRCMESMVSERKDAVREATQVECAGSG
ncbi:uncharacterized protein FIESC28_10794 [Fusarium coffeatum]|uniref:FAD-dependent oxidoreductase 2 FAD-binding domain-containing protein n=1 Tax=Fusarium coffeatum TaxID=231269 RepID=A0A366QQP3_9HYPO|nr:uncharacterized protein FIESC28_10794 [Fusarium coffeatum]RBR07183.1 hypothetical protein FIESC28_10794 [Fusarium coffeatum]